MTKTVLSFIFSPFILFFGGFYGLFNGGRILTAYKGIFGKFTAYFCSTAVIIGPIMCGVSVVFAISDATSKNSVGTNVLLILVYLAGGLILALIGILWFKSLYRKCPDRLKDNLLFSMLCVAGGIAIRWSFFFIAALSKYMVISDPRRVYLVRNQYGNPTRVFETTAGGEYWVEDENGDIHKVSKRGETFSSSDNEYRIF